MWNSRTKNDLIIEVWEKLDCENIGAKEITAIEDAVREKYGDDAVDSPMIIARLLADEGAELRHAEIMELEVKRRLESPYDADVSQYSEIFRFQTNADFHSSTRKFAQKIFSGKRQRRFAAGARNGDQRQKSGVDDCQKRKRSKAKTRRKSRNCRMVHALAAIARNF